MKRIFIACAEPSGDEAEACLLKALRGGTDAEPLRLVGVAGEHATPLLDEPWFSSVDLSVGGASAVIGALPRLALRFYELSQRLRRDPPDLAVLIDAPDWHLRVGALCKRLGVPVLWIVAPQLWAWRAGRARSFRPVIDRLAVLLPFEEAHFGRLGFPAHFVGHPQLESPLPFAPDAPTEPRFWLLPGSRSHEITRNLPVFLDIARRVNRLHGTSWPIWVQTTAEQEPLVRRLMQDQAIVSLTPPPVRPSCCLCAVGTATLLAARGEVPTVLVHRLSGMDHFLAERLVQQRLFALPDVVTGRPLTPQAVRNENPDAVANLTAAFLDNEQALDVQRNGYRKALSLLGERCFSEETALLVRSMLQTRKDQP